MSYSYFRISKSNLPDLIPLFLSAFGKAPDKKSLEEIYDTDFIGFSNIGYIAYFDLKKPVAFYGVFPMLAHLNGNIILIAQSGNTMTHKEYIGEGLNISAAKLTYNLCKENSIKGVFGFPSRAAYPTFKKKLDWEFNETLKRFSFFVPTIPLAIIAQKVKFISKIYMCWIRIVLSFYKKADFFEGSVMRNGQDGIYRNEELWNYKLKSKNIFAIKIGETNMVFKANGRLKIGDIDINERSDIRPILRKLKLLSFLIFQINIVFYVSPDTLLDKKLSPLKKSGKGLPIGFLNLDDQTDLASLKFTYFDFDTFK